MANQVAVNFVTRSSNQLAVELGAQTNAHVIGNATTFGDLPDQRPNVAQNIDVRDLAALPSVATAKSITSTHATAQVTAPVVIIT